MINLTSIVPGTRVRIAGRTLVVGAIARPLMGRHAHHTSEGVTADVLLAGAVLA